MRKQIEVPYCSECKAKILSVFNELKEDELEIWHSTKKFNFYKKGQVIFYEGNIPSGLCCIHDGKVKLYKIGQEGKEQIIRLAKAGDILGYRALISGDEYIASASTLEDSRICFIPKSTIFKLFKKNVDFSLHLIRLLTHDLEMVENRMVNLAQKPVRERLAEALLILKETYGIEKENDSCINVSLSREDLANMVGTATETVIRLLADFKNEKLIATKGKKIEILNLNRLIKVCNISD
jgi:CRP/FNR family transcriptional regulator